MSKSDKIQEDLARAARRAKRLAERASLRADRKAKRASEAADRAEELARRAARSSHHRARERKIEKSIEDLVDDVTEDWTQKAEDWIASAKEDWLGDDDLDDLDEFDDGTKSQSRTSQDERSARGRAHRRRNPRRRSARSRVRSFRHRLRNGRSLYRNPKEGKVCGVCAGFAEYYEVEAWQVRLGVILGLMFLPSLAFTGYFIAYFLMDVKPYYRRMTEDYDEDVFQSGHMNEDVSVRSSRSKSRQQHKGGRMRAEPELSNVQAVKVAKRKFSDLERRLRSMESHVTDSKFELQRELRKISGEK